MRNRTADTGRRTAPGAATETRAKRMMTTSGEEGARACPARPSPLRTARRRKPAAHGVFLDVANNSAGFPELRTQRSQMSVAKWLAGQTECSVGPERGITFEPARDDGNGDLWRDQHVNMVRACEPPAWRVVKLGRSLSSRFDCVRDKMRDSYILQPARSGALGRVLGPRNRTHEPGLGSDFQDFRFLSLRSPASTHERFAMSERRVPLPVNMRAIVFGIGMGLGKMTGGTACPTYRVLLETEISRGEISI